MTSDNYDPLDSILLHMQIISLDSPRAAQQLQVIGETLGDEMLHIAASFLVAHRLELQAGLMPDSGLFKWLARQYPPLPPLVETACHLYIADVCGGHRPANPPD
jgi:hypothetical protein